MELACGAGLSLSSLTCLCSALFSLCSPLSSPLFSLSSCPRWIPSSIPRVLSNCLLALLSPCPSPLSALPLSLLSVFSLLSPLPAPRVTVLAAHRACQHDRIPEEKQRDTNPCSAERPCGADTSQRSGREATANTLRCARREAAAAAAAAAEARSRGTDSRGTWHWQCFGYKLR